MVDTSNKTRIAQGRPATSRRLSFAMLAIIVIGFSLAASTYAQQPESNALLVQAGVSLNKGLNILQQRLDALSSNADILESSIATQFGPSALGDPASAPSALSAVGAEYQANLKEMRASIAESQRLISLAKSSSDQTFAIQLAVSACEWSSRASSFSEELHAKPQPTATAPAASAPKLESMPGFVRDTAELYQKLDQLSGRPPTEVPGLPKTAIPQNTAELFNYIDQLSGRVIESQPSTADAASKPVTRPPAVFVAGSEGIAARNLTELWLRLDELSNRVEVLRLEDVEAPDATTTEQATDDARPRLSPAEGFAGDLRDLSDHLDMLAGRAAVATDPATIWESAVEEFGEGRAGAGGIALYQAAELPADLTADRIRAVAIANGRLQLHLTDRVVALPPVDLDLVAVAYLSVYDGQGTYSGKIVAETSNAIVLQTGKDKFGDVVWKKDFIPALPVKRTKGAMVNVELGPGLGLLAEIAPSVDRVTYYGAIRGTRMGDILLRADDLLGTFMQGVDRSTARPVELNLDGLQSRLERASRAEVARLSGKDQPIPRQSAAPVSVGNEWWQGVSWFVWVPQRVSVKWNAKGDAMEFAETKMRLDAWVAAREASEVDVQFARDVSERYGELRSRYPVLAELEQAAQAVAIVRSLKTRNVPWKDPTQIRQLIGEPVATPANEPRIYVLPSNKAINGVRMPEIRKRTQP